MCCNKGDRDDLVTVASRVESTPLCETSMRVGAVASSGAVSAFSAAIVACVCHSRAPQAATGPTASCDAVHRPGIARDGDSLLLVPVLDKSVRLAHIMSTGPSGLSGRSRIPSARANLRTSVRFIIPA